MTTVASTFLIWTNRGTAPGHQVAKVSGQHRQHIGADARRERPDKMWVNFVHRSREWTELNGYQYDWLTEPAPPPAVVSHGGLHHIEDGMGDIGDGGRVPQTLHTIDRGIPA
jgi:hypothetical protein